MIRTITTAGVAAFVLGTTACTYTAAVSQTNVPVQRDHPVQADIYRFIFVAVGDTDEVAQLTTKLQQKCPGGRVLGITTKDLRTTYFPIFFRAREVVANGYCVANSTAAVSSGAAMTMDDALELDDP
jgi:hypothetical protein